MIRRSHIEGAVPYRHIWTSIVLGIFSCFGIVLHLGSLAAGFELFSGEFPGLLSWEFVVALLGLWAGGFILGRINRSTRQQNAPISLGVAMWAIICCGFIFIDPHAYFELPGSFSWTAVLSQPFRTFLPRQPQADLYAFVGLAFSLCASTLGVIVGSHQNSVANLNDGRRAHSRMPDQIANHVTADAL